MITVDDSPTTSAAPESFAGIPAAAVPAWHALSDALEVRGPATCESGTVLPPETWWSRRPTEQRLAVSACELCPVMTECRAYVDAAGEPYGVWAGLTAAERQPS